MVRRLHHRQHQHRTTMMTSFLLPLPFVDCENDKHLNLRLSPQHQAAKGSDLSHGSVPGHFRAASSKREKGEREKSRGVRK